MSFYKPFGISLLAFSLAGLTACGGGTELQGVDNEQETVANNTGDTSQPGTPAAAVATASVSGRVADGYLKGAIVCIDINENAACDDDEPQAVTGDGGVYSLVFDEEHEGKPIVAEVPETAIDEDTGEAFGKRVVFSAPGDRPEFVSPITTFVQEQLRANPGLDGDTVKAKVLQELGLAEEDPETLFTDYVKQQKEGTKEEQEKYEFLHQTARVTAGMLGEIREQVEAAAIESGFDLEGDEEARKALQQLVVDEVRALLPEIAAAVVDQIQPVADSEQAGTEGTDAAGEFDPAAIITELRADESEDDYLGKLEEIRDERPIEPIAMADVLQETVTFFDRDCHDFEDEYYPEEEKYEVDVAADGTYEDTVQPYICGIYRTDISVGDNNELIIVDSYYNPETGLWEELLPEYEDDVHTLMLIDGQWVARTESSNAESIVFNEDGSAVVTRADGRTHIIAMTRDVSGLPILKAHLLRDEYEDDFHLDIAEADVFAEGSHTFHFHITEEGRAVFMPFLQDPDVEGALGCETFNGNCNHQLIVAEGMDPHPAPDLETIQWASVSVSGVVLPGLGGHFAYYHDYPVNLRLLGESDTDELPVAGTVVWEKIAYAEHPEEYPEEYPESPEYVDGSEYHEPGEVPTECEYMDSVDESGQPVVVLYCPEIEIEPPMLEAPDEFETEPGVEPVPDSEFEIQPYNDVVADPVVLPGTEETYEFDRSEWRLTEIDGVVFLAIDIPHSMAFDYDDEMTGRILLTDHDGFVRRAFQYSHHEIETEIGFNPAATESILNSIAAQ